MWSIDSYYWGTQVLATFLLNLVSLIMVHSKIKVDINSVKDQLQIWFQLNLGTCKMAPTIIEGQLHLAY